MTPIQKIEDRIRSARTTTSKATDQRIIALGEAEMTKRNEQSSTSVRTSGVIRRMIRNSTLLKLATAAVILIATGLGMYVLTGSVRGTSITMAQVRQAMQEIDWVQIIGKAQEEKSISISAWCSFAAKVQIYVYDDGKIVYYDFKTGMKHVWSPGSKVIHESRIEEDRQFAGGVSNIYEGYTKIVDSLEGGGKYKVTKKIGTYQGRKVEIWMFHRVKGKPKLTRTETATLYVDVEKKLPLAMTDVKGAHGDTQHTTHADFSYPDTGPADIYEAGAPRSARIVPAPEE